jgi:shikimate kinase
MILKLKRTPGIYLVGFMGCGKTTVGRRLAGVLGWTFVDIDDDIEASAQRSISEIFDTLGEPEFRRLEAAAIADRVHMVEQGHPMVLSLGGGAFAQQANYEMLAPNGVSIWLDCPFEIIRQRLAKESHRPLARDPKKLKDLYEARLEAYGRADFRIEVIVDDPQPAVEQILHLPIF